MPKIDEAKESLAMLKLWLGVIVGVFTAIVGWTLNKFKIDDDVLIALALFVLLGLIVIFIVIVKKINATIKEIGKMKK